MVANDYTERTTTGEQGDDARWRRNDKGNKSGGSRFPRIFGNRAPESSRDPLVRAHKIMTDSRLDDESKAWLLEYSTSRFRNRQRMAYWGMFALLGSLVFITLAALIDGVTIGGDTRTNILGSLKEVQQLLVWMEGFLAAIVATYFGVTSCRPSS